MKVSIAVTGLENAGKTTLVHRIIKNEPVQTHPTYGVDVEFADYQGYPLQIWDLGGHQAFRRNIWRNYVIISSALIYIVDLTDLDRLEQSYEWFIECVNWIKDKSIPLLVLVNKIDKIERKERKEFYKKFMEIFNVRTIKNAYPSLNFKIFIASALEGIKITSSLNWLLTEFSKTYCTKIPKLLAFCVVESKLNTTQQIMTENFNNYLSTDAIPGLIKQELSFYSDKQDFLYNEFVMKETKGIFMKYESIAMIIIIEKKPLDFIPRYAFLNFIKKMDENSKDENTLSILHTLVEEHHISSNIILN